MNFAALQCPQAVGNPMNDHAAFATFRGLAASLLWTACAGSVVAQEIPVSLDDSHTRGAAVRVITPVFDQIVSFVHPVEFGLAFEDSDDRHYVQEHVPAGESTVAWSQMISLSGQKGLAAQSQLTPATYAQQLAEEIQRSCPDTFAARPLGSVKFGIHDGFVALAGCGRVNSGMPRSEVVLLVTVKGSADYYSIQWAERDAAMVQPPLLDEQKWKARFRRLGPIRVCDKVPGEGPPYPSCIQPL